jgi:uncharacterized protein YdhG (YjbR/CyaY superfamily)
MENNTPRFLSTDEYIASFPAEIQEKLVLMRATIKAAAPNAQEKISYQMPAFALHGILVYFAAFKHHIGFFPTASGIEHFKPEISEYASSKGTIQFPLDRPLPIELISKIVAFRLKENLEKAEAKGKK